MAGKELFYEQKQNRNFITRYLHSFRYRNLIKFVREHYSGRPVKILDIGCGPGGAYQQLSKQFDIELFGVDIREDFIDAANERYSGDNVRFSIDDATDADFRFDGYDLIIALETFEHIPEGKLVRVIERIAAAKPDFLLCSVPIEIGPAVAIKNFGARAMGYNRQSGNFMQTIWAATYNLNKIPTHDVAHLGFNWIWLEQTLRQNFEILRSISMPFKYIPKMFSPSVLFVCKSK